MIPVLTPAEMGEVDRTAPEPVEVLVRRAAGAVARTAVELLGQAYGARVVVVAGPGNNGWDGRVAGELLSAMGVSVRVVDATDAPPVLPASDLGSTQHSARASGGATRSPTPTARPCSPSTSRQGSPG